MIEPDLTLNPQNANTTVVVGMSGGVDSSVAALLLKMQGYNVIGIFMKNWEEEIDGECSAKKDYDDVVKVCRQLEIPYYAVEFIQEYQQEVFSHFLAEYQAGHTPNPDILCNREIKFKVFLAQALKMGADYLATGHYCQTKMVDGVQSLLKGVDGNKDQSYFLYTIKDHILKQVLFPLGGLVKPQIRQLATDFNLATSKKKDSTGICFIGERDFREFLSGYIPSKPGNFESLDGQVVGRHHGAVYYTIGQRKGLGLGGEGEPWFVTSKDMEQNIVYVVRGADHPSLLYNSLEATELSWVDESFSPKLPFSCSCKVRYRQLDQECIIERVEGDRLWVTFPTPQRALALRQSIVFYQGDHCLGGAMVAKT